MAPTLGCTIHAAGGIMYPTPDKEPDLSQPNLTLCMIVRDEQEMLPEFLQSCNGLWDEFIVADTGSVDQSVALLENAGAEVFHFPWVDDFSAARNASLEKATGRWILFLDADERPTPELVTQIRTLLEDPQAGAATVVLRNQWPDGTRQESSLLRLFRNDPSIRFKYLIHEDPSDGVRDFLRQNKLKLRHLPGVLQHLGYLRETVVSRDKKTRDLELLRRSLETHPRDFYCWFKIMEIGRFWGDDILWEETATSTAALLETATEQEKSDLLQRPFSGEMAALVAQQLDGSDEERLNWLEASKSFASPTNAWHLRRGLFFENLGRMDEATSAFQTCLANQLDVSSTVRPLLGLCRLALVQQKMEEAADFVQQACEHGPVDSEALLAAVTILPLTDAENQPRNFVNGHLKRHPQAALDLARALVPTGNLEMVAEILEPLMEKNSDAALGFLLCSLVLDKELDLQLDVDQQKADMLFQNWIHLLWKSRQTVVMSAFADGCGAVLEIFPWLPDFLNEETRKLRQ